ncbi:uncharacterized protein [Amphiura filiformis]|uniref:uncharacterized protein isoform X2 n=1 Tax=Amphiura filiformis TaxID=82378 RepID=UPI003B2204D5
MEKSKDTGNQKATMQYTANGESPSRSSIMIENDQNFFSSIISQESPSQTTTSYPNSNGGSKYQCRDAETPSMQINKPPKVNNGKIWTSGQSGERKRQRKYYMKLTILAILMVLFLSLVIISAVMYTMVKTTAGDKELSSRYRGTTTNHKTSSPSLAPKITGNYNILSTVKPSLSSTSKSPSKTTTIPLSTDKKATVESLPPEMTTVTEATTEFVTTNNEMPLIEATTEFVTTNNEMPLIEATTELVTTNNEMPLTEATTEFVTTNNEMPLTEATTEFITTNNEMPLTEATTEFFTTNNEMPSSSESPTKLPFLFPTRGATIPSVSTPTGYPSPVNIKTTFMTTLLETTNPPLPPGCQEIPVDVCRQALSPRRGTTFTSNLPEIYNVYNSTIPGFPTCHVDAIKTVCSLNTIPCENHEFIYPCRSTCLHVANSCFKEQNRGMYDFWLDAFCTKLPESTDEEICFGVSSNNSSTDVTTNSCNSSYCMNNGKCFDMNGQPFCRCSSIEYAGRRCELSLFDIVDGGPQVPGIPDGSCQPISDDQCAEILPYNQTFELIVSGVVQKPPWDLVATVAACNQKTKLLFCAEIIPEGECSPENRPPYVVCRDLCLQVRDECAYFFAALQFPFRCNEYPEETTDLLCI